MKKPFQTPIDKQCDSGANEELCSVVLNWAAQPLEQRPPVIQHELAEQRGERSGKETVVQKHYRATTGSRRATSRPAITNESLRTS